MTNLNITPSIEIENLLTVLCERLKLTWDEAESQAFEEGLFPESTKTFVTASFGGYGDDEPLKAETVKLLAEKGLEFAYVTNAI